MQAQRWRIERGLLSAPQAELRPQPAPLPLSARYSGGWQAAILKPKDLEFLQLLAFGLGLLWALVLS